MMVNKQKSISIRSAKNPWTPDIYKGKEFDISFKKWSFFEWDVKPCKYSDIIIYTIFCFYLLENRDYVKFIIKNI